MDISRLFQRFMEEGYSPREAASLAVEALHDVSSVLFYRTLARKGA